METESIYVPKPHIDHLLRNTERLLAESAEQLLRLERESRIHAEAVARAACYLEQARRFLSEFSSQQAGIDRDRLRRGREIKSPGESGQSTAAA